jgi:Phage integrase family.
MAQLKARGNSYCVIYTYQSSKGNTQQWETYSTQLEAIQRKALIDHLQKTKQHDQIRAEALEYKRKYAEKKSAAQKAKHDKISVIEDASHAAVLQTESDNTKKTYAEFVEKWLPFRARREQFSPQTYDSYSGILKNHILPVFGNRIMSTITAQEIDDFVDALKNKKVSGSRGYRKMPQDLPTLASSTVKKCYNVLTSGFKEAERWGYVSDIPRTSPPSEKFKKRAYWTAQQFTENLEALKDDRFMYLVTQLAFVFSLRAGETVGIDINRIDLYDRSLWITQQVIRVSDDALQSLKSEDVIRVFPKQKATAKTSIILKSLKTEGSYRKNYIPAPLMQCIRERLDQIERNKEFFGSDYQDYGLLICYPNGCPIESKELNPMFKKTLKEHGITDIIEFQGLRKSGQMHKVRLTQNDYQLVAETGGHSPQVLMSNYNEAMDSEKRKLAALIGADLFHQESENEGGTDLSQQAIFEVLEKNPEMKYMLMQLINSGANIQS